MPVPRVGTVSIKVDEDFTRVGTASIRVGEDVTRVGTAFIGVGKDFTRVGKDFSMVGFAINYPEIHRYLARRRRKIFTFWSQKCYFS